MQECSQDPFLWTQVLWMLEVLRKRPSWVQLFAVQLFAVCSLLCCCCCHGNMTFSTLSIAILQEKLVSVPQEIQQEGSRKEGTRVL